VLIHHLFHGSSNAILWHDFGYGLAVVSDNSSQQSIVHPAVSELLKEFESVFAPPTSYPPAREFDHAIPLIPEASPVQVRPYRYLPAVKDKIERQVTDMLKFGIIPSK
jgi:hypothetical protein